MTLYKTVGNIHVGFFGDISLNYIPHSSSFLERCCIIVVHPCGQDYTRKTINLEYFPSIVLDVLLRQYRESRIT